MTLEGRFSHGGNVKTFVAAFAVCFMNIWAILVSGILPLKSKIRINVIPSPGFKLVVLIGFRDDSWVFLNVFLNGHHRGPP
jgi:hypothetical protein